MFFNLSGNFTQNITGMTDATGRFSGALTGTTEKIQKGCGGAWLI